MKLPQRALYVALRALSSGEYGQERSITRVIASATEAGLIVCIWIIAFNIILFILRWYNTRNSDRK